jgi:hypothetical protein
MPAGPFSSHHSEAFHRGGFAIHLIPGAHKFLHWRRQQITLLIMLFGPLSVQVCRL